MADTLSLDLRASLVWLLTESLDLSNVTDHATLEYKKSVSDGVSFNEADLLWHDERTVSAGSNDDLNLSNLSLTLFGHSVSVTFATVTGVFLVNTNTASGENLLVGGAGAGSAFAGPFNNDADAQVALNADSCLWLVSKVLGWTVTAGTGDVLRIENTTGSDITYKIAIVGTSS